MDRPECMYFLGLGGTPAELREANRFLLRHDVAPDVLRPVSEDLSEYKTANGPIPEWHGMERTLRGLSAEIPGLSVRVRVQVAGAFHPDRALAFGRGSCVSELSGRRMGPGELDLVTVQACVDALAAMGMDDAALALGDAMPGGPFAPSGPS